MKNKIKRVLKKIKWYNVILYKITLFDIEGKKLTDTNKTKHIEYDMPESTEIFIGTFLIEL